MLARPPLCDHLRQRHDVSVPVLEMCVHSASRRGYSCTEHRRSLTVGISLSNPLTRLTESPGRLGRGGDRAGGVRGTLGSRVAGIDSLGDGLSGVGEFSVGGGDVFLFMFDVGVGGLPGGVVVEDAGVGVAGLAEGFVAGSELVRASATRGSLIIAAVSKAVTALLASSDALAAAKRSVGEADLSPRRVSVLARASLAAAWAFW